jgi:hypothetical protein
MAKTWINAPTAWIRINVPIILVKGQSPHFSALVALN